VGTSGAMRVVFSGKDIKIPDGIWCYRVDRERRILGGALSNGGEVFKWASRTLNIPDDAEQEITGREPGSHGLMMLPFFSGERSPYWRADLRASIIGMSLATTATDILHAALESVALRFRQIYDLLTQSVPEPKAVIASGGALLHSSVWTGMIADALGRPLVMCEETEASSRGAALLAAERSKIIPDLDSVPVKLGGEIESSAERSKIYERLLQRDNQLFKALYGSQVPTTSR
jgi:gluconokinase